MQKLLWQLGTPPEGPAPRLPITVLLLPGEGAEATAASLCHQVHRRFTALALEAAPGCGGAGLAARLAEALGGPVHDYILLAQPGVRLLPHALFCFASEAEQTPADLLYADDFVGDAEAGQGMARLYPPDAAAFCRDNAGLPAVSLWRADALRAALRAAPPGAPHGLAGALLRHALGSGSCASRHICRILAELPPATARRGELALRRPLPQNHMNPAFLLYASDTAYTRRAATALAGQYPRAAIVAVCEAARCAEFAAALGPLAEVWPDEGGPAALLSALLAQKEADCAVVLTDLADVELSGVFEALLGGLGQSGAVAASPLVHLAGGEILYAGAVAGGVGLYQPLFAGRRLSALPADGLVRCRRQIGLLCGECFAVTREGWQALGPFEAEAPYSLRALAMELSFRAVAAGRGLLYCGEEALLMTRRETRPAFTATGGHCLRWLREYPGALREDAATQRLETLHLNHIGYECFANFPGEPGGGGRRVLAITHELTLTGAPVVLLDALRVLKAGGDRIVLASPADGPLRPALEAEGITVLIDPTLVEREDWAGMLPGFDLVFVCTVVLFPIVKRLLPHPEVPVFWWLHDADASFSVLQPVLPQALAPHVHVWCGGAYAQRIQQAYRPAWPSGMLLYGVEDRAGQGDARYDLSQYGGRCTFAFVGSIEPRKGQDILARAIGLLPEAVREACVFLFVGRVNDPAVFAHIRQAEGLYPGSVHYIEGIPRADIDAFYRAVDCLVCSSRDDPMPVYITEGMMLSRVVVCSENTGTAALLRSGENGYLYGGNDPARLAEALAEVAARRGTPAEAAMQRAARATYEECFTMQRFAQNLGAAMEETMRTAATQKELKE